MNYTPTIADGISSLALVISAVSLWFSWRGQRHSQIVSFEQRRQEVRQILLEGQLIVGQISNELNRTILISEKQLIVGTMSEGLKRKFLEATKIARAEIARNDVVRHEYEKVLTQLDQIPPSTQEHVELERLWGKSIQMKNAELAALEKARKGIQNLENVLDEIQLRRHPKSEG